MEHYHIQETTRAELFGLVGGIILFFYMILGSCAEGFNWFKMRYEVGRQLYRQAIEKDIEEIKKKKKVDSTYGMKQL